jgi:hypothetical protein
MPMTTEEHMLMLALLMKQHQSIKILLDVLKSRYVLTGDDAEAFEFSQTQDAASNAALYHQMKEAYLLIAKSLGIETGLEKLPQPPVDWFRPPQS